MNGSKKMGFLRQFFWTVGLLMIIIDLINVISAVVFQGLTWDNFSMPLVIFWFVIAIIVIVATEIYVYFNKIGQISEIGEILDNYQRVTEQQIIKKFDKPAYKILPIFKAYKKGILVLTSGIYIHYNKEFIKKFTSFYKKNDNITELSNEFELSKTEIKDIIKKLKEIKKIKTK